MFSGEDLSKKKKSTKHRKATTVPGRDITTVGGDYVEDFTVNGGKPAGLLGAFF